MSLEEQFWWNWAVYFGTAAGTILAVVVALFGQVLRPKPKLVTTLANPLGVRTPIVVEEITRDPLTAVEKRIQRPGSAVWFHVNIQNKRRWATAREVQIFLTRLEEPDSANNYQTSWVGEIPLKWANGLPGALTKTVGTEGSCDLCSVQNVPGNGVPTLTLHPLIWPFALGISRTGATKLRLTVQAKSVEADAAPIQIEVHWDGGWSDDREEMAKRIVLKKVGA